MPTATLSTQSTFLEIGFWMVILASILAPASVFGIMLWKRVLSGTTVLLLAIVLILLAGIDVVLLQKLAQWAQLTPSDMDNRIFASEISIALYLMPALLGGVGINLVSNVLIQRISAAQKRFDNRNFDA